ncbi:hypothetical protein [Pannonibacter sp.]|uniref:hypothetical protein n=1 Tax=Pannonibacter sp. TaxID=1906786 RepID=UPI003F707FB4
MTRAGTAMSSTSDTLTLHVPFRLIKRGGRKEIRVPDGSAEPPRKDDALVKALARAFRWKRMLEAGDFATLTDLARHEGVTPSFVTRILRLTLLAPDLVEAILDGKQGPKVTLAQGLEPFPLAWQLQGTHFSL